MIRLNDTLLLGPDPLGTFIPIPVKSIHRKRMPVKEVHGGQTASFALKKVGLRRSIRRDADYTHSFSSSDQALIYKERHGDALPQADATGHLGV